MSQTLEGIHTQTYSMHRTWNHVLCVILVERGFLALLAHALQSGGKKANFLFFIYNNKGKDVALTTSGVTAGEASTEQTCQDRESVLGRQSVRILLEILDL